MRKDIKKMKLYLESIGLKDLTEEQLVRLNKDAVKGYCNDFIDSINDDDEIFNDERMNWED